MSRETFRSNFDASRGYAPSGKWLNRAGLSHEATNLGVSHNTATRAGIIRAQTPPPPGVTGLAVIVDASNDCRNDPSPDGGIDAPCASVNKYTARFRWIDHDTQVWSEYGEDLRLDASGYWEGLAYDAGDDPAVVGTSYPTNASQSPSRGVGFGAIPVFAAGDVVPAYWDASRGWLVPIVSPPSDPALGEFFATAPETIVLDATLWASDQPIVGVQLEVQQPNGAWVVRDSAAFRLPVDGQEVGLWLDTRTAFLTFYAPNNILAGTRFRITAGRGTMYEVYCLQKRVRFTGLGRYSTGAFASGKQAYTLVAAPGALFNGWTVVGSIPHRYKDAPSISTIGSGVFEIDYLDDQDGWLIGVEVSLTIGNTEAEGTSQSAVSGSSTQSYISESSSSQSATSWGSRSWLSYTSPSSSTQSYTSSSQTLSTSSQTMSTSSVTVSTSSATWDNFCCVTLVSDVYCDAAGHVEKVCYRSICFPTIGGLDCDASIGEEICYPCDEHSDRFSSSPSSQSSPSSSTQSITSSSQTLSTSSSVSSSESTSGSAGSSATSTRSWTSASTSAGETSETSSQKIYTSSSPSSSSNLSSLSSTSYALSSSSSSSVTASLSVPESAAVSGLSALSVVSDLTSFGLSSASTALSAFSTSSLFFFLGIDADKRVLGEQ